MHFLLLFLHLVNSIIPILTRVWNLYFWIGLQVFLGLAWELWQLLQCVTQVNKDLYYNESWIDDLSNTLQRYYMQANI